MAQDTNGYELINEGFPAARADINEILAAVRSSNSGGSTPGDVWDGLVWLDTAAVAYKLRYDSSWLTTLPDLTDTDGCGLLRKAGGAMTGCVDFLQGSTQASATNMNLARATVGGNVCDITGTTTIATLGTAPAGAIRFVRFTGALTLTHSASLLLPSAANIVTVAGDVAVFVSRGSNVWVCAAYQRYGGYSVKGCIGFDETHTHTKFTCSTDIPVDDSPPLIAEGNEILNLGAYTPKNASSSLILDVSTFLLPSSGNAYGTVALFEGTTCIACWPGFLAAETSFHERWVVAAASLVARTYTVRVGPAVGGASSIGVNAAAAPGDDMGATIGSSLTLQEML